MIISRSFLLTMSNVLNRTYRENRAVYEMWENMVQPNKQQKTIQYGAQNIRFAYRITKARIHTHTHTHTHTPNN